MQQQLQSRVAAWGQDALAACADFNLEVASMRGEHVESDRKAVAAEKPDVGRRMGSLHAGVLAEMTNFRAEQLARLTEMRDSIAQKFTSQSLRLETLENQKVCIPPNSFKLSYAAHAPMTLK